MGEHLHRTVVIASNRGLHHARRTMVRRICAKNATGGREQVPVPQVVALVLSPAESIQLVPRPQMHVLTNEKTFYDCYLQV
jgi:hypothetical protein